MGTTTAIEKHVNKIVERLALPTEEQEEMKVEFISHLEASKADYEKQGYSEKEAEKLAISRFGESEKIADDMHEAVFPHRKLLFVILAGLSLITAFGNYLTLLFAQGDAAYGALITAVLSSTALLLLSEAKYPKWEKKPYLITFLVIHALFFVYQSLAASSIAAHFLQPLLGILSYTIVLFTVVLIYRVAVTGQHQSMGLKWLHVVNITVGIIVTAYGLFFLWAMLAFGGGFGMVALLAGVPFLVWLIAYVLQVQFIKHHRHKTAYTLLALLGLVVLFFAGFYLIGMRI